MAQKLEAQGGRGGEEWDDGGAYENVKKVYVGQGDSGVVYVKFDYEKDGKIVSLEHGKKTLLGTEEVNNFLFFFCLLNVFERNDQRFKMVFFWLLLVCA